MARHGWLAQKLVGFKLAQYSVENDQLVRGPDGFCVEVPAGSPGELLMRTSRARARRMLAC